MANTEESQERCKGWFPLQPYRTETYRISLFPSTRVELMVSTQRKILWYVTIRLKWKPALKQTKTLYHFTDK